MRFSRSFKSSSHSIPSPDGMFIATILPSKLLFRSTRSLEILHAVAIPASLSASPTWFTWSDSSNRVLVASTNTIRVYSATDARFSASITHPTSGTTKAKLIKFGGTDDEICVFTDFGLRLTIYNLTTSKSVDISSPKLFNPGNATKGISYRPGSRHLALLTRSGGKDVLSLHASGTLEVIRSWIAETTDAQGLAWSPDGRWIAVWESPAHGHCLAIYTADGHLYRLWKGSAFILAEDKDFPLESGIKMFDWSPSGAHVAVGDFSRRIAVLAAPSFKEWMNLTHVTSIKPTETLQVWQEQVSRNQKGEIEREFVQASQLMCPPTSASPSTNEADAKSGTNIMTFDSSGTLLATRTENMPTTIWIWDVTTKMLRTVVIFHSPIAKCNWHPRINELLMIRCEGEERNGLVYLWDPSWEGPKIVNFEMQIPGGKLIGKSVIRWLNVNFIHPAIFFSDSQDCILTSVSRPEDTENVPWQDAPSKPFDIYDDRPESPLVLVPAEEKRPFRRVNVDNTYAEDEDSFAGLSVDSDDADEVDDTFQFRKFVER
ncbi:hypothetical protein F5884DRAFT_852127 [Xylogone sp. PMI_703]|nr:hypothetical protein F5884DRAFT_852127 [Xylogone sp. PMI_703]